MESSRPGRATFTVELANVSPHGFWLFLGDREVFLDFVDFPWFRSATIEEIADVTRPAVDHLRWESLDIDLSVDSIDHPERYPLVSRVTPARQAGVREGRGGGNS